MTLIVHWKPGHGTNVEEPISVIVVLVFSKHIGQQNCGFWPLEADRMNTFR